MGIPFVLSTGQCADRIDYYYYLKKYIYYYYYLFFCFFLGGGGGGGVEDKGSDGNFESLFEQRESRHRQNRVAPILLFNS